jgi:hypothetical protein
VSHDFNHVARRMPVSPFGKADLWIEGMRRCVTLCGMLLTVSSGAAAGDNSKEAEIKNIQEDLSQALITLVRPLCFCIAYS